MSTRLATQQTRHEVRPLFYWLVVVSAVALCVLGIWHRRVIASLREENTRIQERLSGVEGIQAQNIELQRQRDRLLQSEESAVHQVQLLRAEVQQLRERTNELAGVRLAQVRASQEISRLEAENLRLKVDLSSKPRAPRVGGWLGVNIRNAREQDGLEPNSVNGVVIISVVERSPAEKAQLRPGDVVLSVDKQPVASVDGFKIIMAQKTGGQFVALDVARRDTVVRVDVKPLDWPQ